MFRKILIPTDGSALSEEAASAAIALARGSGAEIVALCVAQECDRPDGPADEGTWAARRERALSAAAQRAGRIARLAREAGVPHSLVTAMASSEHDEIIRIALDLHCDLIFLAAHGQCGVTRLIAGRVPQLVLAYSPVPVIMYRGSTVPA
ncbi:universal stress protein [Telluria beijingensis]|uniref:universal stress protein n=1 Tax=Telluria beijingensis TaxID=3068633 RepID=UPI0027963626|nr:universal stress protein [Massilia sp. REN29]